MIKLSRSSLTSRHRSRATLLLLFYLTSFFVADEQLISSDNTLRIPVDQINLLLPLVCTRFDSLALRLEHLRSTFNNLKSSVVDDLDKLCSRVSLLQDIIGQDPEIADFPLRNPWEGISFLNSSFSDTISKIFPVLQTMHVPLFLQQVKSLLAKSLQSTLVSFSSLQSSVLRIDGILTLKFSPLERLYAACSGGLIQPPAAALTSRLNNLASRICFFSVGSLPPLGSSPLLPPPSVFSTRIHLLEATVVQLSVDHKNIQTYIGHDVVEIGGIIFEYIRQTTAWVVTHLPSPEYFIFNDVIIIFDALGSIHLSNRDFLEEKYHASRGKFNNEIAARVSAFFDRELLTIFGRAESTSGDVYSSSVHPLPVIKSYDTFNIPSTHSGIKEWINDEIMNLVSTITSNISSRLAGVPVALMLANTFLVYDRSHIDSLLTWIESFYQEQQ